MPISPSPDAPDAAAGHSPAASGEPTIYLEPRFCPAGVSNVRGDVQQDIIDILKPVDNDRLKEGKCIPDTEFNQKYPPDAWGKEAGRDARVWKVCRDKAAASDRDMLESWNKTLDVLLIFAGLFSAVSTAFLIESYKTLQPDHAQYVAMFLYSAAVAYNRSGSALPPLDVVQSPEGSFHRSTIDRWINALWFISLTISLLVALLSILIKQWLEYYRARVSRYAPDHAYWARRHALYHDGLLSWGVPVVISCLPLLLHVSLFLFLGGLVLFLQILDEIIARALLVFLALFLGLYLLSIVLPVYYVACPSTMPLLTHALSASSSRLTSFGKLISRVATWLRFATCIKWRSLQEREKTAVLEAENRLNIAAIAGLMDRTTERAVLTTVVEAMGAFPAKSVELFVLEHMSKFYHVKQQAEIPRPTRHPHMSGFEAASLARRNRASLALSNATAKSYRRYLPAKSTYSTHLRDLLGIEGAFLYTMTEWEPGFTQNCGIRNLVAALRDLEWIPSTTYSQFTQLFPRKPGPGASDCLLLLGTAARIARTSKVDGETSDSDEEDNHPLSYSPHFYSFVILVFCASLAGNLLSDDKIAAANYLVRVVCTKVPGLRNSALTNCESSAASSSNVSDYEQAISGSINALYTMLARMDEYNIHPDVAVLVTPYIASYTSHYYFLLEDQKGLCDFILSKYFCQYSSSAEALARYAEILSQLFATAYDPRQITIILRCSSVLALRAKSLDFSPEQYDDTFCGLLITISSISHRRLQPVHTDVALLSHFVADTTALDRWTRLSWHCSEHQWLHSPIIAVHIRTALAARLAIALRRQLRMNRAVDPSWVHALFAHPFVVQGAESILATTVGRRLTTWRLAPSAHLSDTGDNCRRCRGHWAGLCDRLQNTCAESGLSREAIARVRDGLLPGDVGPGGVVGDCDDRCACMLPYGVALGAASAAGGSRRARSKQSQSWTWRRRSPEAGKGIGRVQAEV